MTNKEIKPLVNTSSLDTRKVTIQGSNDFSNDFQNTSTKEIAPIIKKSEFSTQASKVTTQNDSRKKANKTQKMSDDVILKIDILKPFLKELEDVDTKVKPTVNDMINLLLDNYIHTKLTTKELEAYQSIYKIRYDQL